jgi:Tol biopolymer transport system component
MTVYQGGEVWAQEASTARVDVADALVRVAPNTIFTFGEPAPETMRLDLEEGQMWIDVEGLDPGENFEVETPGAVASVRGTRFSVRTRPDGATIVSTQVNAVTVVAASVEVTVTSGYQTTVLPGQIPGQPTPMSLDERVRWGMATTAGLDVLLPAVGESDVFTYTGWSSYWDWTPNGDYLGVIYYDENDDGYSNTFYTATTGMVATMTLPFEAGGFSYSPAGNGLVYLQYNRAQFTTEVCTAENDGANPSCWGGDTYYAQPDWSPDGQWLAFPAEIDGPENIYTSRPDGSDLAQLTFDTSGQNVCAVWSPVGDSISYIHVGQWNQPAEIWVTSVDGTSQQMLYDDAWRHPCPTWSPDGAWLAAPGFGGGLALIRSDGSETQIVPGTEDWTCREPVWSPTPDGWPLFFHTVDDLDRQQLRYVTGEGGTPSYFADGWGPIWSDDGSQVAFGLTDYTGWSPLTQVHIFQSVPEFWY